MNKNHVLVEPYTYGLLNLHTIMSGEHVLSRHKRGHVIVQWGMETY